MQTVYTPLLPALKQIHRSQALIIYSAMARKLPWSGDPEPPVKRQRTIEASVKSSTPPNLQNTDDEPARPARGRAPPSTPSKRRARSRSPSTSPPPAPPDVEPMVEGYDADDTWMMVEDEFQTLAQSFTRHLHHAEYKRLVRKAREAPRKVLPEPVSPMSKKTKQRLQRGALASKQQEALDRIISGKSTFGTDDPEEEKVEDPWRGTHLAGLMATGSQEKTSLKGLERMPSSTRAAKGFSCIELDEEKDGQVSASRHIFGGSLLHKKDQARATDRRERQKEGREVQPPMLLDKISSPERTALRRRESSSVRDMASNRTASNGSRRTPFDQSPPNQEAPRKPPLLLKKRKQVKEASKEDRLAEMPMFLM